MNMPDTVIDLRIRQRNQHSLLRRICDVKLDAFTQRSLQMEFRRRHNDYYATLFAMASRDSIGVVTAAGIESELWLGTCDRVVVRLLPGAESVLLDIEAWRKTLVEPYERLPACTYMVGARIECGVLGVMDGQRPMIRRVAGSEDRLGRTSVEAAVQPTPWFMRSL